MLLRINKYILLVSNQQPPKREWTSWRESVCHLEDYPCWQVWPVSTCHLLIYDVVGKNQSNMKQMKTVFDLLVMSFFLFTEDTKHKLSILFWNRITFVLMWYSPESSTGRRGGIKIIAQCHPSRGAVSRSKWTHYTPSVSFRHFPPFIILEL